MLPERRGDGFVPINLPRCWIYLCSRMSRVIYGLSRTWLFPIALRVSLLPSFLSFLPAGGNGGGEVGCRVERIGSELDFFTVRLNNVTNCWDECKWEI